MAEEEQQQEQQEQKDAIEEIAKEKKNSISKLLPWIILGCVVLSCAGMGFGLGRVLAGRNQTDPNESTEKSEPEYSGLLKADESAEQAEKTWYFDLEPVVANLNEPGVTRYVRTTITLEISINVDQKDGEEFLVQKLPLLKDWLTLHLANQTLEDMRGEKNLRRIQSQILDNFNQKLFPGAKPQIKRVLFKEFAIQ